MLTPQMQVMIIDNVLAQIYGQPCWGVQHQQKYLTLEFGQPYLKVRKCEDFQDVIQEATHLSKQELKRFSQELHRRKVFVFGEWHLWILSCDWAIENSHKEMANSNSQRRSIAKAAREIDSQILIKASVNPKNGNSIFEFDYGGKIKIENKKDEIVQNLWVLYEPSKYALTVRSDGKYAYHHETTPSKDEIWQNLANLPLQACIR